MSMKMIVFSYSSVSVDLHHGVLLFTNVSFPLLFFYTISVSVFVHHIPYGFANSESCGFTSCLTAMVIWG